MEGFERPDCAHMKIFSHLRAVWKIVLYVRAQGLLQIHSSDIDPVELKRILTGLDWERELLKRFPTCRVAVRQIDYDMRAPELTYMARTLYVQKVDELQGQRGAWRGALEMKLAHWKWKVAKLRRLAAVAERRVAGLELEMRAAAALES